MVGEVLKCIEVSIEFKVQATFESTALATQFSLVDAEILIACHGCGNAFEFVQPAATTKLSSAASDATNFGSFLASANLLHFNFNFKVASIEFDQFSEINPVFCGIIECCFAAICLKFNFANFHHEFQLP